MTWHLRWIFKGGTEFLSREGIGIVPELIALRQATSLDAERELFEG